MAECRGLRVGSASADVRSLDGRCVLVRGATSPAEAANSVIDPSTRAAALRAEWALYLRPFCKLLAAPVLLPRLTVRCMSDEGCLPQLQRAFDLLRGQLTKADVDVQNCESKLSLSLRAAGDLQLCGGEVCCGTHGCTRLMEVQDVREYL